jgi:DNA polymerase I-like protein with 3'-5' exonuclease and polymerase domains
MTTAESSMLILEFDLAGAEWVVVAYLSRDPNMLEVVRSGKSPHIVTGALISGAPEEFVLEEHKVVGSHTDATTIEMLRKSLHVPPQIFLPRVMSIRQAGKKSNHGLNYNMKYRRFALENEMLEADAQPIVERYVNVAYPGIKNYWESIRKELKDNKRTMVNCFGRRVKLRGEWGEELFNQAYSFKPQSTVVDIVNAAMVLAYEDESPDFENFFLGAQVHDSLHVQAIVPQTRDEWLSLARMVLVLKENYMRPTLSYNGVEFKLGCDAKLGINWGNMESFKTSDDIEDVVTRVRAAYDVCLASKSAHPAGSEEQVEEAVESLSEESEAHFLQRLRSEHQDWGGQGDLGAA